MKPLASMLVPCERGRRIGLRFAFLVFAPVLIGLTLAGNRTLSFAQTLEPIRLPLEEGQLDMGQLYEAVGPDLHWIAGATTTLTHEFQRRPRSAAWLPSDSPRTKALMPSDQVGELLRLFPGVFALESATADSPAALVVDRNRLTGLLAQKKRALRYRLAAAAGIEIAALRKVDATWPAHQHAPARIVIVLHGMHSTLQTGQAMAVSLHDSTSLPFMMFSYPNDAPVVESAEIFAHHLDALSREYPDSQVSVVGYSLGGLVSRAALELPPQRSMLDNCRVDQLILVCPPNGGSALWEYAPLLEGAEILQRLNDEDLLGRPLRRIVRAITDGLNEASADLNPNAALLQELNQQNRCPQIRYSVIAGDQGPLRPTTAVLLQLGLQKWQAASDDGPLVVRLAEVARMAELQRGQGDGVVRLEATQLTGVSDWEVLPIDHLTWGQVETKPGQDLLEAITKRLVQTE